MGNFLIFSMTSILSSTAFTLVVKRKCSWNKVSLPQILGKLKFGTKWYAKKIHIFSREMLFLYNILLWESKVGAVWSFWDLWNVQSLTWDRYTSRVKMRWAREMRTRTSMWLRNLSLLFQCLLWFMTTEYKIALHIVKDYKQKFWGG